MPPPAKKRKTKTDASATHPADDTSSPALAAVAVEEAPSKDLQKTYTAEQDVHGNTDSRTAEDASTSASTAASSTSAKAAERLQRFKSLQARAKTSAQKNLKAATIESQRLATDPSLLANLHRKSAIAQHNLLKADAEAAGEDFERKRAWDWTIEESERWDKRMRKKASARDDQAFQDYRQDSKKVYERQMRDLKPDMEGYEKGKVAAIEKAAATGGLEIVETEDGELVAVDKEGTFYSTADSTTFVEHKPEKNAVDKLVKDLNEAEQTRLKKSRRKDGDDGDVTYINEGNKRFNQRLARSYDKYTTEIRDSFERGTMI